MQKQIPLIIICGPTASGKTALGIDLAVKYNGEIVSADSMQVYKEVDIATAKPDNNELKKVRHFLISELSLSEEFSAFDFVNYANRYIKEIAAHGKIPIIVGGTGLYIRSLIYGISDAPGRNESVRKNLRRRIENSGLDDLYTELLEKDREYALSISKNDPVRIIRALEVYYITGKPFSHFIKTHRKRKLYNPLWFGIDIERKELYDRINRRVLKMLDSGLIEETKKILEIKNKNNNILNKIIGYQEIKRYLEGKADLQEVVQEIQKRTRRYAKRQLTWFRKEKDIIWVDLKNKNKIYKLVEDYLNNFSAGRSYYGG